VVPAGATSNLPLRKNNLAPRIGVAYSLTQRRWFAAATEYSGCPAMFLSRSTSERHAQCRYHDLHRTVDGVHPFRSITLPFPDGIFAPPGRSLGTVGTQQFSYAGGAVP